MCMEDKSQDNSRSRNNDNESNDKTAAGRLRRRVGQDTEQLVPDVPGRTLDDGTAASHEGAAAQHRGVSSRQVLHRH